MTDEMYTIGSTGFKAFVIKYVTGEFTDYYLLWQELPSGLDLGTHLYNSNGITLRAGERPQRVDSSLYIPEKSRYVTEPCYLGENAERSRRIISTVEEYSKQTNFDNFYRIPCQHEVITQFKGGPLNLFLIQRDTTVILYVKHKDHGFISSDFNYNGFTISRGSCKINESYIRLPRNANLPLNSITLSTLSDASSLFERASAAISKIFNIVDDEQETSS